MSSRDIGMDLGTASILVYVKGKGIALCEPSVVAIDVNTNKIKAVGADAQKMLGRTPGNIIAVRPLREGVISDYVMTEKMIKEFIKKVLGFRLFKPNIVVCIPSIITEVEERAVTDACLQAGAKRVFLIEEPVAAAIGAGIDISKPDGNMVVDIGGGTADIAVISLGGIVESTYNPRAQELVQLWEILVGALEQLSDVLGKTVWTPESFLRLLRLLLSQYDVGTIPPVLDAVTAGPVSAMRCQQAKHLFVLGASEGNLPSYAGSAGILSDQERVALRKLGVPLTGGAMEGVASEFAEIYGVFCGVRESIHISCASGQSAIIPKINTIFKPILRRLESKLIYIGVFVSFVARITEPKTEDVTRNSIGRLIIIKYPDALSHISGAAPIHSGIYFPNSKEGAPTIKVHTKIKKTACFEYFVIFSFLSAPTFLAINANKATAAP